MSRNEYDSVSGTLIPIGGWQSVDQSLSGTSNNPLANHVINAELQKANGAATSQTLTTGSTSVTFDIPTTGDNLIEFYTSTGINYTAIDTSTAGEVTLSFDEQEEDVIVYCNITASRAIVGLGNRLEVTCDYEFAGVDVTCTNGTKTFTKICPTTEPYVVEFEGLDVGTWTVSATANNKTKFATATISDSSTELVYGFNWRNWVDLSKNYSSTDFSDLEDVFADEEAVRELMTVHDSADYLIEAVTEDADAIDVFCENDTAMKWIGLRDYVCDGLTAIEGVWAKFLASDYWERILKDHMPVMTSNTAPYGTAIKSSEYTNYPAYYAIYGGSYPWCESSTAKQSVSNIWVGYTFTNPIKVNKFSVGFICGQSGIAGVQTLTTEFKIQASNDGFSSDIHDLTDSISHVSYRDDSPSWIVDLTDIDNDDYYMSYRVFIISQTSTKTSSGNYCCMGRVGKFKLYGRSLNVSVPVMTSNTAPFGEVSASSVYNDNYPYGAFDKSEANTDDWQSAADKNVGEYIQYDFGKKILLRMADIVPRAGSTGNHTQLKSYKIQGSNDGTTFEDIYSGMVNDTVSTYPHYVIDLSDNQNEYSIIRLVATDVPYSGYNIAIIEIQYYGVDYSEREFEVGTTKKWLYDHGLELVTFETFKGSSTTSPLPVNENNQYYLAPLAGTNNNTNNFEGVGTSVDLTSYNLVRCSAGDNLIMASTNAGVLDVWTEKPVSSYNDNNRVAQTNISTPLPAPNELGVDISSVNGIKFVAINTTYANNRSCSFKELWLE